jgi:hypothetical protein
MPLLQSHLVPTSQQNAYDDTLQFWNDDASDATADACCSAPVEAAELARLLRAVSTVTSAGAAIKFGSNMNNGGCEQLHSVPTPQQKSYEYFTHCPGASIPWLQSHLAPTSQQKS